VINQQQQQQQQSPIHKHKTTTYLCPRKWRLKTICNHLGQKGTKFVQLLFQWRRFLQTIIDINN